jgi:hypothetical protein
VREETVRSHGLQLPRLVLRGAIVGAAGIVLGFPLWAVPAYCCPALVGGSVSPRHRRYRTPPRIVHGIGVLRGYVPRARVLPLGSRWVYRCEKPNIRRTCGSDRSRATIYACVSRRTGLICVNSKRHGFWIGRFRGYRLF